MSEKVFRKWLSKVNYPKVNTFRTLVTVFLSDCLEKNNIHLVKGNCFSYNIAYLNHSSFVMYIFFFPLDLISFVKKLAIYIILSKFIY